MWHERKGKFLVTTKYSKKTSGFLSYSLMKIDDGIDCHHGDNVVIFFLSTSEIINKKEFQSVQDGWGLK